MDINISFINKQYKQARQAYEAAESIFNNTTEDSAQEYAFQEMRVALRKMSTLSIVAKINEGR